PVELTHDLDARPHRARDRHAVIEHVVLIVAARWIAEDAEPDVADDPHRLHGLSEQSLNVKVGRVEPQTALVAGVRQPRREPETDCGATGRLREHPDLRGDDDVPDAAGGAA